MKNTTDIKNVILIDSQDLSRTFFKNALQTRNFFKKIHDAESVELGIELSKNCKPDLVILDNTFLGNNNFEAVTELKRINNNVKIIILASQKNEDHVLNALCAGVRAYCPKNISIEKLFNVINAISEGAIWFDPAISGNVFDLLTKDLVNRQKRKSIREKISLTEREAEVLKLIVDGCNNAEISEKLCVSIHTTKAHVCKILYKLKVEDRTQAAIMALKHKII